MTQSDLAVRVREAQAAKAALVNIVSAAMIKEPSFDVSDEGSVASKIKSAVNHIAAADGEFILKLAVYVRDDIGLRGTANLLVALAAYEPNCQVFLEPYVRKIANLPSDWLQMATFARDMPGRSAHGIPNSLRVALSACFDKFNEHSLAKYNKDGAQKAKVKRAAAAKARAAADGSSSDGSDSDSDDAPPQPYTLKQMIRMLHVSAPRYYVMCLLGKRYPESTSEFVDSGLAAEGRDFDPARAGARMRLAVPTTWETQLAARGNKPEVWDELVSTSQLPFMAMLRNLRNIILAGCSPATHDNLIGRLTSDDQIASSRQFPYRFFSAFDVLDFKWGDVYVTSNPGEPVPPNATKPKKGPNGRPIKLKLWPDTNAPTDELIKRYRSALDRAVQLATALNIRPIHGRTIVVVNLTDDMLSNVTAAGGARGIGSVRRYVDVAALLGLMFKYACEDSMFLFSRGGRAVPVNFPRNGKILENMEAALKIATDAIDANSVSSADQSNFPFATLETILSRDQSVDAIVTIDTGHKVYTSPTSNAASPVATGVTLPFYLSKLRRAGSPNLLFVSVDVTGTAAKDVAASYSHANDVLIAGFSDSILRFVAERGAGGPLAYIERIDEVKRIDTAAARAKLALRPAIASTVDANYRADDAASEDTRSECSLDSGSSGSMTSSLPSSAADDGAATAKHADPLALATPGQRRLLTRYVECRFFMSSTYLDMASERDALVLEVFPALRRRCLQHGVKATVAEVDLRWGITSEDAANKMTLSVCLNEVARCAPFFLGVVGARRGYCPPSYDFVKPEGSAVPDRHFAWLKDAPPGLSITELEFRQALASLRCLEEDGVPIAAFRTALMLMRDSVVTAHTAPASHRHLFQDAPAATKAQKQFIAAARHADEAQCVRYRAPFVAYGARNSASLGMDDFKRKALAELWRMVCAAAHYSPDQVDRADDSAGSANGLDGENAAQETALKAETRTFAGRAAELAEISKFVSQGLNPGAGDDGKATEPPRIMIVGGLEGSGKSATIATAADAARRDLPNAVVVHHNFGVGDRSPLTAGRRIVATIVESLGLEPAAAPLPTSADDLAEAIVKAITAASKYGRVIVFLDNLECADATTVTAALPALVPAPMPALDIRFVVSCRAGSPLAGSLRARRPSPLQVALPDLEPEDRAEVVRRHLRVLGRKLQETVSRGNQLLPLTKKAESSRPGYLVQALTFLRLFATFDTLDRDIRSVPSSSAGIQTDMLARFEKRFTPAVCRPVLQALVLSQPLGGMLDTDLERLGPEGTVADARQLLNALEPVVDYERGTLRLNSQAVATAAAKKYFRARDDIPNAHAAICAFLTGPLEAKESSKEPTADEASRSAGGLSKFSMRSVRDMPTGGNLPGSSAAAASARTELPYNRLSGRSLLSLLHHSLQAKHYEVVEAMASSILCVESIIESGLLPQLLNAVADLATAARLVHRRLGPFVDFLVGHRHILARHRTLTLQCALNMPARSPVWDSAMRVPADVRESRGMILWGNRDAHGEADCTQTTVITRRDVLCSAFDDSGKVLAVAGKDWACRLFNVYDGTVTKTLKHPNDVTNVVVLRSLVITGCEDGQVRVWNRNDGALVATGRGHTRRVNQLAVHPEGAYLLSCSDDGSVRKWGITGDSSRMRTMGQPARKHGAPVSTVAIHSGGKIHASGGWEGRALFWSYDREVKPVWFNTKRRGAAVRAIAFNPSMVVIAAIASYDGGIDLFDFAGEVHQVALSTQHLGLPLTSVDYSTDGKRMLTADTAGSMRLWRASVTGEVIASYNGHSSPVNNARFNPANPKALVSASADATVRHWDAPADGDERPITTHSARVSCVAFAPNGEFLVTAARDGRAHFVDLGLHNGEVKFVMDHKGARVAALAISPDSKLIVTGDSAGTVRCWDSAPGVGGNDGHMLWAANKASRVVFIGFEGTDEDMTITAVFENGLSVHLRKQNGSVAQSLTPAVPFGIACAAQLRRDTIMGWGFTSSGAVYSGTSARKITVEGLAANANGAWASASTNYTDPEDPSTRLVAFAHTDGTVRVFEAHSGCEDAGVATTTRLMDEFHGGSGTTVHALRFASATRLVVGCADRSVRVLGFDAAHQTLRQQHIFFATAPVTSLAAHPTTGAVVAGDSLGNVYQLKCVAAAGTTLPSASDRQISSEHRSVQVSSTHSGGGTSGGNAEWDDEDEDEETPSLTGLPGESDAALEARFCTFEAFAIITREVPPDVRGPARKAWFVEQRNVLRVAMRLQRKSPHARLAMRLYAQRAMQLMSAHNRLGGVSVPMTGST